MLYIVWKRGKSSGFSGKGLFVVIIHRKVS